MMYRYGPCMLVINLSLLLLKGECSEVTDASDGFCNTQFFGSVEGTFPIASNDVIFTNIVKSKKNGAVVKLGVVPYSTHAIIHAGTSDGMIRQVCYCIFTLQ